MNFNLLNLCKLTVLLAVLVFNFSSCSKDAPPKPDTAPTEKPVTKSTGRELIDVKFAKASNSSMSEDGYIHKGNNNLIYVTLPQSLNSNTPSIELITSKNSSVKINNVAVTSNSGKHNNQDVAISISNVNIDNVITVEVTSESGQRNSYDILAQKGIKEFDKLIYAFKEKYEIPGVSFAIANVSQTTVAYKSGFGYGIKETKTRVQPNHLFRLASMSKQHTAISIVKLIEQGKFQLDDLVFGPTGILKDKFSSVPTKAAKITVRHLLEHTSGFKTAPDFMFDSPYSGFTMEQRIDAMLKSTHPNEPGTVFGYYNTGYGILGYIIEKVTGKSFDAFLKEIYVPAGITDIQVGGTQAQRRNNEVAYYAQSGYNANGSDMEVRASAGGVIASTEQLFKLLWTIDGKNNVPDILNATSRAMMFTPSTVGTSRYALGWRVNHSFFPGSYYHGGNLAGVATFWVYTPEYAVVFLCNSRSYISDFDDQFYVMARDIIAEAKRINLQ